jgi:hypothetical protein
LHLLSPSDASSVATLRPSRPKEARSPPSTDADDRRDEQRSRDQLDHCHCDVARLCADAANADAVDGGCGQGGENEEVAEETCAVALQWARSRSPTSRRPWRSGTAAGSGSSATRRKPVRPAADPALGVWSVVEHREEFEQVPVGSRKSTAAAGIQPLTLGSFVSSA